MLKLRSGLKSITVFGRVGTAAEHLEDLKSVKLDRLTKEEARKCILAASFYEKPSTSGLEKIKTMVAKNTEPSELTARIAAFGAATALKLNNFKDADSMLRSADLCPSIIFDSLRINSLAGQDRIHEALDVLEGVLLHEEHHFRTENYSVCEESLDKIHQAIKDREESSMEMKRFRSIQRLITKYGRRSQLTLEEALRAPLEVQPIEAEPEASEELEEVMESGIIEQVPHFLSEKRNV